MSTVVKKLSKSAAKKLIRPDVTDTIGDITARIRSYISKKEPVPQELIDEASKSGANQVAKAAEAHNAGKNISDVRIPKTEYYGGTRQESKAVRKTMRADEIAERKQAEEAAGKDIDKKLKGETAAFVESQRTVRKNLESLQEKYKEEGKAKGLSGDKLTAYVRSKVDEEQYQNIFVEGQGPNTAAQRKFEAENSEFVEPPVSSGQASPGTKIEYNKMPTGLTEADKDAWRANKKAAEEKAAKDEAARQRENAAEAQKRAQEDDANQLVVTDVEREFPGQGTVKGQRIDKKASADTAKKPSWAATYTREEFESAPPATQQQLLDDRRKRFKQAWRSREYMPTEFGGKIAFNQSELATEKDLDAAFDYMIEQENLAAQASKTAAAKSESKALKKLQGQDAVSADSSTTTPTQADAKTKKPKKTSTPAETATPTAAPKAATSANDILNKKSAEEVEKLVADGVVSKEEAAKHARAYAAAHADKPGKASRWNKLADKFEGKLPESKALNNLRDKTKGDVTPAATPVPVPASTPVPTPAAKTKVSPEKGPLDQKSADEVREMVAGGQVSAKEAAAFARNYAKEHADKPGKAGRWNRLADELEKGKPESKALNNLQETAKPDLETKPTTEVKQPNAKEVTVPAGKAAKTQKPTVKVVKEQDAARVLATEKNPTFVKEATGEPVPAEQAKELGEALLEARKGTPDAVSNWASRAKKAGIAVLTGSGYLLAFNENQRANSTEDVLVNNLVNTANNGVIRTDKQETTPTGFSTSEKLKQLQELDRQLGDPNRSPEAKTVLQSAKDRIVSTIPENERPGSSTKTTAEPTEEQIKTDEDKQKTAGPRIRVDSPEDLLKVWDKIQEVAAPMAQLDKTTQERLKGQENELTMAIKDATTAYNESIKTAKDEAARREAIVAWGQIFESLAQSAVKYFAAREGRRLGQRIGSTLQLEKHDWSGDLTRSLEKLKTDMADAKQKFGIAQEEVETGRKALSKEREGLQEQASKRAEQFTSAAMKERAAQQELDKAVTLERMRLEQAKQSEIARENREAARKKADAEEAEQRQTAATQKQEMQEYNKAKTKYDALKAAITELAKKDSAQTRGDLVQAASALGIPGPEQKKIIEEATGEGLGNLQDVDIAQKIADNYLPKKPEQAQQSTTGYSKGQRGTVTYKRTGSSTEVTVPLNEISKLQSLQKQGILTITSVDE